MMRVKGGDLAAAAEEQLTGPGSRATQRLRAGLGRCRPGGLGSALAVAAALLAACGGEHAIPEAAPEPDPVAVKTAIVERLETRERIEVMGTVEARETAVIASRVAAYIESIRVREGDFVRAGRTLVELDGRELRAGLELAEAVKLEAESAIRASEQGVRAAEARLELAAATFRRFDALAKKDSVTAQELDEATAGVRQAEAALAAARAQKTRAEAGRGRAEAGVAAARTTLSYTSIESPVSGRVIERMEDAGSLAAPGRPILRIEKAGAYRLAVAVPESQAFDLAIGDKLAVRIDALGAAGPREGRVVEMTPAVDPGSRTMSVKLALPASPRMRSGVFGYALLPGPAVEVAAVPRAAVVERGQLKQVFVVRDGRATRRMVQLGAQLGEPLEGYYPVRSGLDAGEEVVLAPGGLADGVRVTATRESGR